MSQNSVKQATQSPLTGLLNRRGMPENLNQELVRSQIYSRVLTVMMYDIHYFKTINKQYSHD